MFLLLPSILLSHKVFSFRRNSVETVIIARLFFPLVAHFQNASMQTKDAQ